MRPEVERLGKAEGTRPVSSGRVRQTQSKSQEKMQLGSSQANKVDRGSGSAFDVDRELGQVQGW